MRSIYTNSEETRRSYFLHFAQSLRRARNTSLTNLWTKTLLSCLLLLGIHQGLSAQFVSSPTTTFPTPLAASRVMMADFDNDGDADILYQTGGNGTAFAYAQSNGNGTYTAVAIGSSPFAGLTIPDHNGSNFRAADFDNDGDIDLWVGVNSTTGSYFRNDGASFSSQSTVTCPAPGAGSRTSVADFDNDGDADILYQTVGNGTPFAYSRNNGNGTFTAVAIGSSPFAGLTIPDNSGTNFRTADFDGDGDVDLWVGVNGSTGSYFRNDGTAFSSQSTATFPSPAAGARTSVADYDGDGDADILYQTGANGTAFGYYKSNGNGTYTNVGLAASPFAGVTLVDHSGNNYHIGDIDGDGDFDTWAGIANTFFRQQSNLPPQLVSTVPADNATGVSVNTNLVLTFNETIATAGSGTIVIRRSSDDALIEAIAGSDGAKVSGLNSTTITINPAATLAGLTSYYVQFNPSAFFDADGMTFGELNKNTNTIGPILDKTFFNFTTEVPSTTITSINRAVGNPTNAASVTYTVTFAASVTGLTTSNFSLTTTGLTGASITGLTGSGTTYTVTVNTGTGDGTLTLNLANSTGLAPGITTTLPFAGQMYTVDKTAPNTTILSGPPILTNSNTASFGFSSNESPATFEASLDGGAYIAVTSPKAYAGLADGAHTFSVRAIDAAGNVDATPDTYNWTVDATAPNTTITSNPPAVTNSATATFTFTSNESPVTFEASLDGAVYITATTPLIYAGLADGAHTFAVRAIDAAGNVDATPATYSWTIDNTPPAAPVIASITTDAGTSATDGITNDQTLIINGTAEANSTVTVSLDAVVLGTAPVSAGGTWSYNNTGNIIAPGAHNFTATATDAAGNTGTVSAAYNITIDVQAPAVSSVAVPANGAYKAGTQLNFTITFTEPVYITGGTPSFTLVVGGTSKAVTYVSGSGTANLLFRYTVAAGDNDNNGVDATGASIALNGAQMIDAAGNNIVPALNNIGNTTSVLVDTDNPSVILNTSAANPLNTAFSVTATFSEAVSGLTASDFTMVNGAVSALTTTDNITYTMTVTPTADGLVIISLPANMAIDAATNGNNASNTLSRTYDATRPTVVLSSSAANPLNAAFSVTAVFSEAVAGLTVADFTMVNGTASALTTTDNITYTMTVTPTADGLVSITLPANMANDAATNGNMASNTVSRTYDATRPSVVLSSSSANPLNTTFSVSAVFTEAVAGLTTSDFTMVNGTVSALATTDNITYTMTVTPVADGLVSITLPANMANDAATNGNNASNTLSRTYDATRPTVVLSSSAPNPVNVAFGVTAVFSEAVSGLTASDFTMVNGAVSALATTDNITYTMTVTPTADGLVSINLPANMANDAATNGNMASNTVSRTYDATRPTVVLSSSAPNPLNTTFGVTAVFSEAVSGLTLTDFTMVNGTVSALATTDNITYTMTVTPTADGLVSITLPANMANDAATNGNMASNTLSRTYDFTRPTVVLSSSAPNPLNTAFGVTAVFSEAVSGLTLSDFTMVNGTVSALATTDNITYTMTVTPTADGLVSITLPANMASDAATNGNTASNTVTRTYDGTRPTVVLSSSAPNPLNTSFSVTAVFSEAVTGLTIADFAMVNGTVSGLATTNNITYTMTVTATANGLVSITLPANMANDAATNGNFASNTVSRTFDNIRPDVMIVSTAPDPLNTAFSAQAIFTESVSGLTLSDFTVANATLSNLVTGNNQTYTFNVTPVTDGLVSISLPANMAADAATNGNTASGTFTRTYDVTSPGVVITTTAPDPTNAAIPLTITFTEKVRNFVVSDVIVTNAALGSLSTVDSMTYFATATPVADGLVTAKIAAGAANDWATNANTASNTLSLTFDFTRPDVVVSSSVADPTNAAFTTTFAFSEAMRGFDLSDLTLVNATSSALITNDSIVFNATITPLADGTVAVSIAANAVNDKAGNGNTASNVFSVWYDATAPTVVVSTTSANPTNTPFPVAVTFSEKVRNFDANDLMLTNATASAFATTDSIVYTALVTPVANGNVSVKVNAGAANDWATNPNTASNVLNMLYDNIRPEVTITAPGTIFAAAFNATITFTEKVSGFTTSGLTMTNVQTISLTTTDSITFTAAIQPAVTGNVGLQVREAVAHDAATNTNLASNTLNVWYDATRPRVVVASATTDKTRTPFPVQFVFSEPVSGFISTDVNVDNGTVSQFVQVNDSLYTALITPIFSSDSTLVSIPENAVVDVAGNGNIASDVFGLMVYTGGKVVKVFPNPSNGHLVITYEGTINENATVMLIDMAGRKYERNQFKVFNNQIVLDIDAGVPGGMYQVVIKNLYEIHRENVLIIRQ